MPEIKARKLHVGEEFYYSGRKFVALGLEQNGILAVSKEPIKNMPFDKDGSNDWRNSSLRKYLNVDFIKKGFDPSGLLPFASDLTADDGLKDYMTYGQIIDFVFLLSADLYRKYRYAMPTWNTWSWLITPWTNNGIFVRSVAMNGILEESVAYDCIGAAFACLINPESIVSCDEQL